MGVGGDARRGVQGRPSSPAPLRRELPPDLPRYPPSPTQRGDAGPCVVWRPWVGAVSWLLRRNVSQSLACSDQPAAAEPVPAPLSLVNFPLAAVDSKVPPLEIFSRFRHGLGGGAAPAHVAPSTSVPAGPCPSTGSDGGFWFGEPVQPVQRRSQVPGLCAALRTGRGWRGWLEAGRGWGSPRSLLLPRS